MLLSTFFFFSLMSLATFLHNSLITLHLLLFTTTFFASPLPPIFAALALFTKIFASALSTRGALLKTLAVLDKRLGRGDKGDRLVANGKTAHAAMEIPSQLKSPQLFVNKAGPCRHLALHTQPGVPPVCRQP